MVEYFRRTDDAGPDAAGGGSAEYTDMDGEEGKNPGEYWRGGGVGDQNHHGREYNRNLNIGTESRFQIADALGKELHHPKMSKLWDLETRPTDRQTDIHFVA